MKYVLLVGLAACGGSGTEWTSQPLKPQVAVLADPSVKIELDLPEGTVRLGEERGNRGKVVEQSRFRFDSTSGDKTDLTLLVDVRIFTGANDAGRATLDEFLETYGKSRTTLRKDTLPGGYIVTQHTKQEIGEYKVTVVREIDGKKIHCQAESPSPALKDSQAKLEAVCLSMRTAKS